MPNQNARLKISKKAFTMIELLICLVCIGFICVGIGSFASAIKSHSTRMNERETVMMKEYQDVLNLKEYGLDIRDKTNYPEYIHETRRLAINGSFNLRDIVSVDSDEKLVFESEDETIIYVDDEGKLIARNPGVTYVFVNILELQSDGKYHDVDKFMYVPFIVMSDKYDVEFGLTDYVLYGGKYYVCWIHNLET